MICSEFSLLLFQTSKDHLIQGNLLKTTLLNEKQNNLEKEMYGNISLYSQFVFHLGQELMFMEHTFTFQNFYITFTFYLLGSEKLNIQ